jgi:alpha-acetolactate decarboxylase
LDGQTLGGIQLKELAKHGDFGLGTFELADGEMILFDGTPYHMKHDGSTSVVKPDAILPYAMVIPFKPSINSKVSDFIKYAFQKHIESLTPTAGNYFLAIRVDGLFKKMKVRLVKAQDIPRESVLETVRKKSESYIYGKRGRHHDWFSVSGLFPRHNCSWLPYALYYQRSKGGRSLPGLRNRVCGCWYINFEEV